MWDAAHKIVPFFKRPQFLALSSQYWRPFRSFNNANKSANNIWLFDEHLNASGHTRGRSSVGVEKTDKEISSSYVLNSIFENCAWSLCECSRFCCTIKLVSEMDQFWTLKSFIVWCSWRILYSETHGLRNQSVLYSAASVDIIEILYIHYSWSEFGM